MNNGHLTAGVFRLICESAGEILADIKQMNKSQNTYTSLWLLSCRQSLPINIRSDIIPSYWDWLDSLAFIQRSILNYYCIQRFDEKYLQTF